MTNNSKCNQRKIKKVELQEIEDTSTRPWTKTGKNMIRVTYDNKDVEFIMDEEIQLIKLMKQVIK